MSQQAPSLPILPQLIETLRSARYVVVLTGAGVSAESRIPTFRDAQTGLWAKYSPEELATPQTFRRNPKLVWEWYAWRRELVAKATPNPGHMALAELEQRIPKFTLITQNVDGLHQRAGSKNIIELHGNFGESLPQQALAAAFAAAEQCDFFLSIGTSGLVQPAASLPIMAVERGATVVEVNPDITMLTGRLTHFLRGPAGQVLPALVKALELTTDYSNFTDSESEKL